MDPDACLQEALELAAALEHHEDADAQRLAELVLALNSWISRGGFLPADWQRKGK